MTSKRVDVDEDLILYIRQVGELEDHKAALLATKRRMLLKAGWEAHAPGSPVWLDQTTAKPDRPHQILTTEWLRERYKDTEMWVDPETKSVFSNWSGVWALHWRRVQKSCALITTGACKR